MSSQPKIKIVFVIFLFIGVVIVLNLALTQATGSCQANEFGIDISGNWHLKESSSGKIAWAKQLTPYDYLLAASSSTMAFFRGTSNDKCVTGDQVIALDAISGEKKWVWCVV